MAQDWMFDAMLQVDSWRGTFWGSAFRADFFTAMSVCVHGGRLAGVREEGQLGEGGRSHSFFF
jgi:hypothetical protein